MPNLQSIRRVFNLLPVSVALCLCLCMYVCMSATICRFRIWKIILVWFKRAASVGLAASHQTVWPRQRTRRYLGSAHLVEDERHRYIQIKTFNEAGKAKR